MILAWVVSLLLLCSSLVVYLERLAVLRTIEVNTMQIAQEAFIAAEKSVAECEKHIGDLSVLAEIDCFIEPAGNQHWLISSKQKPVIKIHVFVNKKTHLVTRLNWRQAFE